MLFFLFLYERVETIGTCPDKVGARLREANDPNLVGTPKNITLISNPEILLKEKKRNEDNLVSNFVILHDFHILQFLIKNNLT